MKLSILITLLNEELVLPQTHREISNQLEKMLDHELTDYELLYIDDGSNDKTFELIEGFAKENKRVKYIRFSRNFGRESGILAGFKYASGDAVMVMDGDLQHPPYLIPLFLEAYNEGYDIVSGQRTREGESFIGSSFARLFYFLSNRSMDVHLTDGKSELRLLSRKAMEAFVYLVFELMKYILSAGNYVSGYFTTIAAIILFSGVQLIFIGILGEYIGKIYYEVKRRPHFIIEETNIEKAKENHIG